MSKSNDLLGLMFSTATVPIDDDPGFDGKGYTALVTPEDNDPADEDEDDSAYQGLLDSGLSQEEAQETVDFMKPLNTDERDILEETPLLDGLTRVDDPEHDRWIEQKTVEGHKAIDRALEDAVYGDNTMAYDEEGMERNDTDAGWGFKSMFKKVGRGLKKGLTTYNPSYRVAKKGFGAITKQFMPNRDAQKANMVRSLYRKLWFEHANWLATQDRNAGRPLQPRGNYEATSKAWARVEISKQGLPMQYAVSGTSGSEMGSWWNPFSWFFGKSQAVLANTQDARSPDAPTDQPAQAPEGMDPAAYMPPTTDPSMANPSMADPNASPEGDPNMQGWNGIRSLKGHGILGEDSLGAYAAQILGSDSDTPAPQPAKDNPYVDKIVQSITVKLKARQPITASELGLLSSASKEGNVSAQNLLAILETRGVAVSGDESGLDPWMYKLNPAYWIASKRKKNLIDIEKKNWSDNADLRKQLAKQKEVLDAAERAAQAAKAVADAKAQSAATEAQLREIEISLKGVMTGSFVGHEKIMPISDVVIRALEKTGKRERAGKLYSKIKEGQSLDAGELKEARQIAKLIGRMKVIHGDLVSESEETLAMHGAFIGACVMGGIEAAQQQNTRHGQFADAAGKKIASGQSLTTAERNGLARVLGDQAKLHGFTSSLVSGAAFVGCPQKKTWTRGAFVGAVKAMSEQDKKMLSSIVKLAKVGNPRAQKALKMLKESGEIAGGDVMGFSLKKLFHYATAPIWLPAKGIYKGEQALFGSKSKGSNPEQVRLAQMKAAYQRNKAAQAKAAAADSQTEAEQRAQQAIANAADAEADAADAEAFAKEQKMKTAEAEANPDTIPTAAGDFIGGWTDLIGKGTKAHKIVKKASEDSPTGTKIRSGATLYVQAKKGNPKAVKAVRVMVAKAKKGDPQALRDVNSVKAGRIAVRARAKAQKRQLVAQKRMVRKAKVASAQRKIENRMGDRLARMSRKHELKKLAIVERKAAKGNPKAKVFVAKRIAASKKGDKKALAQVRGMQLGRAVRLQVTSKQEARRMKAATRMAARLHKNNPKAVRQYAVLKAAANHGNPNAKRAMYRLGLADALVVTVATGAVVLPKLVSAPKPVKRLKPGTLGYKKAQRQIAMLRKKIKAGTATPAEIGYGANLALQMNDTGTATFLASLNDKNLQAARQQVASAKEKAITGTGTREELTCSAKIANQIGDKETAGMLTLKASTAPSSTEKMKQTASEVASAQSGNPTAQAGLEKTVADAKEGKVEAIDKLGNIMAVKTVDAANKGQPISPTMADAINTHALAQSGDPAAQETLRRVSEAATQPNPAPEATLAAGAAVGAAVIASSLANKPKARQELLEKVNPPIPAIEKGPAQAEVAEILAKANEGTATPEEGVRGVELARRLGKPKLAAEIQAKAPPCDIPSSTAMSSLPDVTLPPIRGAKELIKESLRAVTLTTRDPLANYREGVASRSKDGPVTDPAVPVTSSGWSPFNFFRSLISKHTLPVLAVASMPVMAATSVASLLKKNKPQTIVVQAPPPAAAPPTPTTPAAKTPAATATAGAFVGSDSFKDLIANALQSKKMSKPDFNRAVEASAGPDAAPFAKKALAEQTLKFLQSKNVTVGGDFVGASDAELEKLMSQAVTDDHLDRLMTSAVQNDAMINVVRILQKRPDLRKRVAQRASSGQHVPAAVQTIHGIAELAAKAQAGDPAAQKTFSNWCSTQSQASSSGSMASTMNRRAAKRDAAYFATHHKHLPGYRVNGDDSLGAFVGDFVGKSDEFKQLIIAALKTKKMGKDDFNKAVAAHVKSDASPAEKTAAGEKMLQFLKTKNVVISGWMLFHSNDSDFKKLMSDALKNKKMSRDDFNKAVVLNVGSKATQEGKEASAKQLLKLLADKGVAVS